MKLVKKLLLVSLMLIPTIIFAGTAENMELFPEILIVPAFVSIHMTLFVLVPLAQMFSGPEDYKNTVKVLFVTRLIILFVLISTLGFSAVMIDFFAVFLGAFLVVPITGSIMSAKMK
jgi:hypothetical protein